MRKILAILFSVIITLSAGATDYDRLWKEVKRNETKDLQRSALSSLQTIIKAATNDRAYGELLAARISHVRIEAQIAPDSLNHQVEALRSEARNATDPVMKAVLNAILAKVTTLDDNPSDSRSEQLSASDYFDLALANPDILASVTTDAWKRLITSGSDDAIFNHDLLSLIGHEAGRHLFLRDYYLAHGNRRAACIETYLNSDWATDIDEQNIITKRRQALQQAMADYSDLPEAALLARRYYQLLITDSDVSDSTRYAYLTDCEHQWASTTYGSYFTNEKKQLCTPSLNIETGNGINIRSIRNIRSLKLEFYRLKADGTKRLSVNTKSSLNAVRQLIDGDPLATVSRSYTTPPYLEHTDTIAMPQLPWGVYLVKAVGDGITAHTLLYHTDVAVLHIPLNKQSARLVAVSASTGMPLAGASITLSQENLSKQTVQHTVTLKCDSKGEAVFSGGFKPNYVYAFTPSDKAFRKVGYSSYFSVTSSKHRQDIITLLTDRSLYQPGQTLHVSAIVHNAANEDSIRCVSGKKLTLEVRNADHELVVRDSTVTDGFGNAGFSVRLPKDCRNGIFSISCTAAGSTSGYTTVRVEDYKRPSFTVETSDSLSRNIWHDNDTVNIPFSVETLTQLPVADAMVVYSINRRNIWFGYYRGNYAGSRTIVSSDTLRTDGNGRVMVPLHITLPENGNGMFIYTITAKVTNAAGETHEAEQSIRAKRGESKPVKELEPEFTLSAESFPRDGKGVTLTVKPALEDGCSQLPLYLIYTVRAGEKVLEQSAVKVTTPTYTRTFIYKKEYGEGLTVSYIWMRHGKAHSFSQTIRKPQPDLSLQTRWSSFRDRTQPGSKEVWTLKVPHAAAITATVFDKSLDMVNPHSWAMNVLYNSYYVSSSWHSLSTGAASLYASANEKYATVHTPSFARFDDSLFPYATYKVLDFGAAKPRYAMAKMMAATALEAHDEVMLSDAASRTENAAIPAPEKPANLTGLVRTNISESAFFTPSTVADKDGNISLSFTLPETMTTWRLLALVHDSQMRYAVIDTTCVATKSIIVKPNVPRFLRQHDKATLAATVSNTTASELCAEVIMQFVNPLSDEVLWQHNGQVVIPANGTTAVAFPAPETGADSLLVYRIVARTSDGVSDGEQHIIPVLSELETITTSLAFTQHEAGTVSKDLTGLFFSGSTRRTITAKYVEHAVQMILDAVPTTVAPKHNDALSLASAVYVMNMFSIADTAKVTDRLARMQNADGSWSWWEGMDGSILTTTAIGRLLARLQHHGFGTEATNAMLHSAMPFMMKHLSEEAAELRQLQKKYPKRVFLPSELATDILYISALTGKEHKDISFMVSLLSKANTEFTIYGKAHSAVILALNGKQKKACELLESLRQYSVFTPEAGRYYDSPKAHYSWRNYRIPTEVAAMEAIRIVDPQDRATIVEMQRWLLHEKRTQSWDSSVNTADAIYAFCLDNAELAEYKASGSKSEVVTEQLPSDSKVYTHTKTSNGTSWGAVFVEQQVPLSAITSKGSGFTIKREIIANTPDTPAAVGDKVTVRITIKADRDYDFVTVTDNRAANLEPQQQLSGYSHASTFGTARGSYSGYYREVRNNVTNYYFDHMAKGTHVIETTYFIDRQGSYQQGTCTVKCLYAPEFSAIVNS